MTLTAQAIGLMGVLAVLALALGAVIGRWPVGRLASRLEQCEQQLAAARQLTDSQQQQLTALSAEQRTLHTAHQVQQAELNHSRDALAHSQQREQEHSTALADAQHRLSQRAEQLSAETTRVAALQEQLQQLLGELQQQRQQFQQLQQRHAELQSQHAEQEARLTERDAHHQQQLALFEQQKQQLSEQFKLLANDILETKSKALQEHSQASLSGVMQPFQKFMDDFKKEVQDIHHRETAQQGAMRQELATLKTLNQQITQEAHELATALRGQKKLQGNWGELVLDNILERSGLRRDQDYRREVSFQTEDGRQRPDAIVYLPQSKHLIIDAKVSLAAYTRYVNSEDELERQQALREHVQAFRDRINELADRAYDKIEELNSPEVVFMFVPIESAFVEALKADEQLFQVAMTRNILVATPTTLLTSLNIVRQLWRFEDQNKHTAALASKADQVFRKLNTFLASFEQIRRSLDRASEAYVKAEGQLVSGRGNLVKQVADFKQLAPAIQGELPEYFVEKASLEIDLVPPDDDHGES